MNTKRAGLAFTLAVISEFVILLTLPLVAIARSKSVRLPGVMTATLTEGEDSLGTSIATNFVGITLLCIVLFSVAYALLHFLAQRPKKRHLA
jgi:uncharacterized membrane protein